MQAKGGSDHCTPDGAEYRLERQEKNLEKDIFAPEWEIKTAISCILDIILKPMSFQQQLKEVLDVLLSISWLKVEKMGAIFIANSQQELLMIVHSGLAPQLQEKCVKVPFGYYLCGKAAESKSILFRDCVDQDCDIRFDGMYGDSPG